MISEAIRGTRFSHQNLSSVMSEAVSNLLLLERSICTLELRSDMLIQNSRRCDPNQSTTSTPITQIRGSFVESGCLQSISETYQNQRRGHKTFLGLKHGGVLRVTIAIPLVPSRDDIVDR